MYANHEYCVYLNLTAGHLETSNFELDNMMYNVVQNIQKIFLYIICIQLKTDFIFLNKMSYYTMLVGNNDGQKNDPTCNYERHSCPNLLQYTFLRKHLYWSM